MPNIFSDAHSLPQLIQVANYIVPDNELDLYRPTIELRYLRILSTLPTFLLQDVAEISEDDPETLEDVNQLQARDTPLSHRWVRLQHSRLQTSTTVDIYPEKDVLWLAHEIDDGVLDKLSEYYGIQLGVIQTILFEEIDWLDIKTCLSMVDRFPGLKIIYVWLKSYRYNLSSSDTSQEAYNEAAMRLKPRDKEILAGRSLMVEYIDYKGNVFGGFRANGI